MKSNIHTSKLDKLFKSAKISNPSVYMKLNTGIPVSITPYKIPKLV